MSNKRTTVLKKVLGMIKPYAASAVISLLLAVVYVAGSLYIPILVGRAIDCIISAGRVDFSAIKHEFAAIVITASIAGLAQWVMNEMNNRITFCVSRDIRNKAFLKIQSLPLKYLDSHSHGDMVSRVISDVDTFADGLLMGITQLFTGAMTIVGTLLIMLSISWQIALVVVLITPLSLVVANFIAKQTYNMFKLQSQKRGEQTSIINETIGEIKTVQAFGHEGESLESFDKVNSELERLSLKAIFFSSLTNPCTRFVNSIVYTCVGLVGALLAIGGGITVGSLASFLNYANQYTKPFNEISGVITELQNALACAARVFELTDAEEQTPDPEAPVYPESAEGSMEIKHLYFSYVEDKPLIKDLNLKVKPGSHIAIVGPTGCGKTTFINLLMRFYDPNSGEILLDGVNTMDMTRSYIRKSVGMVLQDTWLRSGTIRENISMGKPDATLGEIIEAAKCAHAHSFIKKLPNGYDTVITESGGSLSQGQKQLLCIARVMLCMPPMLFLDEATSSIDTRTESRIQNAFNTMMQGRTSFIVAHRLSTIENADLILVMNDGNIIERGTHTELLKQKGFYCKLYNSQFART